MSRRPTISWGGPLTDADYAKLLASWIDRELADRALIRRVASYEGAEIIGQKDNGTYSGLLFPYVWPGEERIREYRLRRDHPELEIRDGVTKERNKYLSPPGRGNMLYFAPGTDPALVEDINIPIIVTEGEKKCLALHRLAGHALGQTSSPRFLPIGLSGVWNWRGTVGKTPGPDGSRRDVKGPIPDLDRVAWKQRRVYIVFDSNVRCNEKIAAARHALTGELRRRGSQIHWVEVPEKV